MMDQVCPFCVDNGKVKIIDETADGFLVAALDSEGARIPGCYLIIPRKHVESVFGLPKNWQMVVGMLLSAIPEISQDRADFNISYNQGRAAGKRIRHVHAWVVIRSAETEDELTRELGLATIVRRSSIRRSSKVVTT